MPHHHHLLPLQVGEPPHDGGVVGEGPVPVELYEVLEGLLQDVQGGGPPGGPGQLDPLPGGEVLVGLLPEPGQALLQEADLGLQVHPGLAMSVQFKDIVVKSAYGESGE